MKLRFHYDMGKWIMWGYGGRVLYPFILFKMAKKDVPTKLFRHEMEHVYQVQRVGWLVFHARYLWYLIRGGYDNNPFEREARMRANEPLTATEERFIS